MKHDSITKRRSDAPTRVAVAEIGSRSVRLLIADVSEEDGLQAVFANSFQVHLISALGDGTPAVRAALSPVEEEIRAFRVRASAMNASVVRVIGTRALRELRSCGWSDWRKLGVEILSEQEEAKLSLIGSIRGLPDLVNRYASVVLVDQGGGSLEMVLGTTGQRPEMKYSVSLGLGTMQLANRFKHLGCDFDRYREWVASLPSFFPESGSEPSRFIVQGSVATRCAWLTVRKAPDERYAPKRVQGVILTAKGLDDLVDMIEAFPREDWDRLRMAINPLTRNPDELESIVASVILLRELMRRRGSAEVVVSGFGTRHGAAWELAGQQAMGPD